MSTQGYLKPLEHAGIDHKFIPYSEFLQNISKYSKERCLLIPVPSAWKFKLHGPSKIINAFVCESNVIPQAEIEQLRHLSNVWTVSNFCKKILNYHQINNTLMPYCIDQPLREQHQNQDKFTFMCSFDGKFTMNRKGIIETIIAFKQAFSCVNDVRLLVKTFDISDEKFKTLNDVIGNDKRIVLKNEFVETRDLLFDNINCYVSLHASEGFGMHIAEALYRKIPVIVTNYGGNTDFCTPDTSFLVNGKFITHDYDVQYPWNGVWLKPDINAASTHMLTVYNNFSAARITGISGSNKIHNNYNYKSIARQLIKII